MRRLKQMEDVPVQRQGCASPRSMRLDKAMEEQKDLEKWGQPPDWNLRLKTSSIDRDGIFAGEKIPKGSVVIEYVGEVVRHVQSNRRERRYHAKGVESTYMFRFDRDMIIDATNVGNLARFINHSCQPNCDTTAKVINGQKRVLFVAAKDIKEGEELTIDYQLKPEEDESKRVPCNCNTPHCRKYLY
uniref:Histone-lysine N-methyltransferase n=1 Tax=Steinernema glaseri TaxID=37863 RepID=A0A1I7YBQ2_9BILA